MKRENIAAGMKLSEEIGLLENQLVGLEKVNAVNISIAGGYGVIDHFSEEVKRIILTLCHNALAKRIADLSAKLEAL